MKKIVSFLLTILFQGLIKTVSVFVALVFTFLILLLATNKGVSCIKETNNILYNLVNLLK